MNQQIFSQTFSDGRRNIDVGLREYMLKVYQLMSLALILSGICAFAVVSFEPLQMMLFKITPSGRLLGLNPMGWVVSLAPLGIGLFFFMGLQNMSTQTAQLLFWVYAAVTGMSLSSFAFIYTAHSVVKTFFITASVFGAMSIYGATTKRDLTSLGSFMAMGLVGVIIASLINVFMHSSALEFAISFISIFIFMGLIAFDTQKLKDCYYTFGSSGEVGYKVALMGAFTLYLDFVNLFIYMMRFFGVARRDD